jgi:N-acetylmuramoyl-L-alanine amidase
MPDIFLAASSKTYNACILGDNEAVHCGYILDAMIPLLDFNGVTYEIKEGGTTGGSPACRFGTRDANCTVPVCLYTISSPVAGKFRGSFFLYRADCEKAKRLAEIMAENFRKIYQLPENVNIVPSMDISGVAAKVAYHDNIEDATWLHQNIQLIAENLVMSICTYLGKNYAAQNATENIRIGAYERLRYGIVCASVASLDLRSSPSASAPVISSLSKNTRVIVLSGSSDGFVKVRHNSLEGYAGDEHLCLI